MTSGNSPTSSNGSYGDGASFLLGLEIGQLRHRMDLHAGQIQELHRAVSLVMETQQATLTMFATLQSETKTACSTETKASRSTATARRVGRKIVERLSPDILLFVAGRLASWTVRGALAMMTAGGAWSAWAKWLEPWLRSLLG